MVVEVKGPRDRLSERQIVWLRKLQQSAGVEAHVCRVLEPRLKKKRKRSQTGDYNIASNRGCGQLEHEIVQAHLQLY